MGLTFGPRPLVIGRAGLDLYADPPGTPLEQATRFTAALGGSSANIAAALACQGLKPALFSAVSDDAVGAWVLGQLADFGIDAALVARVPSPAQNALALVDTNGPATQAVLYRARAADLALCPAQAQSLDLAPFDALVLTGTVLSAPQARQAAETLMARARQRGLPLVLDLDYRAAAWESEEAAGATLAQAAEAADLLLGNDLEFDVISGGQGLAAARRLARPDRIVIYKRGAAGAVTLAQGRETQSGIFPTQALKPTGAGDGFLGGLLAALAQGRPLAEAVTRGSASAAMVVARVGCAPAMPSQAELEAFLATHPGPHAPAPLEA